MATTKPASQQVGGAFASTYAETGGFVELGSLVGNPANGAGALTLDNGMTAGFVPDETTNYGNPPLLQSGMGVGPKYGGNPNWPISRVGVMRNLPGSVPGLGTGGYYSLYFLYNPNQVQVSFSTNPSNIPAAYLYGLEGPTASDNNSAGAGGTTLPTFGASSQLDSTTATAGNVPNLTNGQSVSWSLMFDRTYDMLYDPNPSYNRGVLKDTAALYALMGTFDSTGGVPISTPVQVVFAQTGSGQLWGFTGYVTSVNITYGIFRHDMIPSRCEIDLTMMTTYMAPSIPGSTGGSGSGNGTGATAANVAAYAQTVQQAGAPGAAAAAAAAAAGWGA